MKLYSEELLLGAFDPITFTSNSSWIVPRGIWCIRVDCVAAQGYTYSSGIGGNGGRVQCYLRTTPGQTLYIVVGQALTSFSVGYNASDIRTISNDLSSRLVVAGGGGSASYASWTYTVFANGGAGGGLTGASGGMGSSFSPSYTASGGGTQSSGGTAGFAASAYGYQNYGYAGGFGNGGAGGTGSAGSGGAGWYGGGGGAASAFASQDGHWLTAVAGAGGSSYTNASLCSNVTHTQGFRSGNGYITLSMI